MGARMTVSVGLARIDDHQQTLEITVRPAPRPLCLEVQDDAGVRTFRVGDARLVVGTGQGAGIAIHDRTVSARHCEVVAVEGGIAISDLGSRNGTFVGGARVRDAVATEGTTMTIGQTTLVVIAEAEAAEELGAPLPGLVGSSAVILKVAAQVRRLARMSAPVLVAGETGVGKELVARALHTEGPRTEGPFVPVNVAALPRELVESELFGHERGAFTGAVARRAGAFTDAEGGTLFLDEIGELPLDAQPKLLRALDGYEVRRVGGGGAGKKANARVVVATHVPLLDQVERGSFRRDLFHRLEVFVVDVPPLRERPGDVVAIARTLLLQLEPEIGRRELTPAAIAQLVAHDWPGNVRELRNVLCRAADVAESHRWLDAAAIERGLRRTQTKKGAPGDLTPSHARELLEAHGGNASKAARAAGVPRTTFRKALARACPGPSKVRG